LEYFPGLWGGLRVEKNFPERLVVMVGRYLQGKILWGVVPSKKGPKKRAGDILIVRLYKVRLEVRHGICKKMVLQNNNLRGK